MADFNHWDVVVSKYQWKLIEAEVDFQQWDNLYISEWWKSLKNPVRYVIPKDVVVKKVNKKIQISLLEMNYLMNEVLWYRQQDYNNEPNIENLEEWQKLVLNWQTYTYIGKMWDEPIFDYDWYFCKIDKNDLNKLIWTKDSICKAIFWVGSDEVEVI